MKTLTLIGAGGKMGCRITNNIKHSDWQVHYLETNPTGMQRLKDLGVTWSDAATALPAADVAIFAVPDVAMEAVTREMVPKLRPGALVVLLDPAAPLDGKVAHRNDLGYFVAHPCHPSVFNWEPTEQGFRDFYGGISAKQAAVCALMHGEEKILRPRRRDHAAHLRAREKDSPCHRRANGDSRTGLVETLAQTCMEIVKEGHDCVVAKGVRPIASATLCSATCASRLPCFSAR